MLITTTSPDSTNRILVDLRAGNVVIHSTYASGTKSAQGVDGKASWYTTGQGVGVATQSTTRRKARVTDAYMASYGWWYPKRLPAEIRLIGKKSKGTAQYWVLRITPDNGLPFDLWIDAKTDLVSREVERLGKFATIVALSDYRTVQHVKVAFQRRTIRVYGGRHVSTAQVKDVALNVPINAGAFTMPRPK